MIFAMKSSLTKSEKLLEHATANTHTVGVKSSFILWIFCRFKLVEIVKYVITRGFLTPLSKKEECSSINKNG